MSIKINEDQLFWIFAIKVNKIQEHYNKYYSNEEVNDALLLEVLEDLIRIPSFSSLIMRAFTYNKLIYEMLEGKKEMTLEKWLMYAIKTTCKGITRHWLDDNYDGDWENEVDYWREEIKK